MKPGGYFVGSGSEDEISLLLFGDPGTYRVFFGDGKVAHATIMPDSFAPRFYHTYGHDGTYDIRISEISPDSRTVHLHSYIYGHSTSDLTINGTNGADYAEGGQGNDVINLGAGSDLSIGSDGNDVVSGGDGNDDLSCGRGNDVLRGGSGDDDLFAGDGLDRLNGGAGADRLFSGTGTNVFRGGEGSDAFFISLGNGSFQSGRDRILDFSSTEHDKIIVPNVGYHFIGSAEFDRTHAEIREIDGKSPSEHIIQGDTDSDGIADFSFIVYGDEVRARDLIGIRNPRGSGADDLFALSPVAHVAFSHDHDAHHMAII